MSADSDTIYAVASGAGRAAVAVMRMSGPATAALLATLCPRMPAPRRASLLPLRDAAGDVLDRALVLWFPGPHSYTGEDSAELHLHAGPAVINGVAERLAALGARPAEAGEFTRRAYLHGRMDLLEAEAIADLVAAESDEQRRQALRQLNGALGTLYGGWATRLTRLVAQQEALIDFPDEDLPAAVEAMMLDEIDRLHDEMTSHLQDGRRGERLRDGLIIAVTGPPNVGKSTLVNALAGRDAAIVSAQAGTTRDVLEVRAEFGGVPVTLLDTAGLRDTDDAVEAEGVRRARARAASADLVLAICDFAVSELGTAEPATTMLVVANKVDLGTNIAIADVAVSAMTGHGMQTLRQILAEKVREMTGIGGPPALTRARHRAALTETVAALEHARHPLLPELRGEELRLALLGLGRVTGQIGTEAILDSVFGQFCIGK